MSHRRQATDVLEESTGPRPRRPAVEWPWLRWAAVILAAVLLHGPVLQRPERALTPAERGLVAVAREALRRGDDGFDYGGFFLHVEQAAGGPIEARWRQLIHTLAEPRPGASKDEGVTSLVLTLFRQANLGHYRREEARLRGLLTTSEPGGNCEAQTKLLVSALRATRPALPEHHELGVEVFQDHVQAVLVDRRRGTLWNLLTGERDAAPRADVYRPAVLLAGYLRGLEIDPPVAEKKLLLARGPRPPALRRGWDFFTTSTLRLPASSTRFAATEPPVRADLPPPAPPPPTGATSGDVQVSTRDEFAQASDLRLLFAMDRVEAPFALVGSTLVFRRADDMARHTSARSSIERRALLVGLAADRLASELASGPIELPPDQLGSLDERDFTARLGRLEHIGQLLNLAEQAIDRGRASTAAAEIELRLPSLAAVDPAVRALTDAAAEPFVFWQRLGRLEPSRRRALLTFLVPRLPTSHVRALALVLGDATQLTLVTGDRAVLGSSTAPTIAWLMDVDLLDEHRTQLPLAPPPVAGAVTGSAPGQPQATGTLPIGAYLDAVLAGLFISAPPAELGPVLARWSPEVSTALAARTGSDEESLLLAMKVSDCVEKPLEEMNRPVPAHLLAALGPSARRAHATR